MRGGPVVSVLVCQLRGQGFKSPARAETSVEISASPAPPSNKTKPNLSAFESLGHN